MFLIHYKTYVYIITSIYVNKCYTHKVTFLCTGKDCTLSEINNGVVHELQLCSGHAVGMCDYTLRWETITYGVIYISGNCTIIGVNY